MHLIILIVIGICIIILIIPSLLRKVSGKRSKIEIKFERDVKLKKEIERKEKLAEIDKANQESKKNDQIFMEKRKRKALKDANFDLFYDEEKELHFKRLRNKYRSKWKGIKYYASKEGDIYYISKKGNRIYINKH